MSNEATAQMGDENLIDDDLQNLLGSRYQGEVAERLKTVHIVPDADIEEIPTDLKKVAGGIGDKLMKFGKRSLVFAAISWLCFYWQNTGLMDASIAVPSMWACAVLAGWGAGRLALNGK